MMPWSRLLNPRKSVLYSVTEPGELMDSPGVYRPDSSAAAAVMALNVEAAGYSPAMARSSSGRPAPVSTRRTSRGVPDWKTSGLKVGYDASASTAPVRGSRATPAAPVDTPDPRTSSRSAASSAFWTFRSIDRRSVSPGCAGVRDSTPRPTTWPRASTSTCSRPSMPRRYCSYCASMPARPTVSFPT